MFKFSGKFNIKTKGLRTIVKKKVTKKTLQAALLVEATAKKLVSKGGGGGSTPSLPGEPPRVQSGILRSSIKTTKFSFRGLTAYIIGPTVIYGKWLEFGTKRMAARPFMRPALQQARKSFKHLFRNIL